MTTKQAKNARGKPHEERKTIVVIDDEVGTVDVLVAALSACGFSVKGLLTAPKRWPSCVRRRPVSFCSTWSCRSSTAQRCYAASRRSGGSQIRA
jgi:hypothetical protein